MADDIKQTLGFDATQAIDTLQKLDQLLVSLNTRFGTVANTLQSFNVTAGKTVAALKQIRSAADDAAASMGKVNATKIPGGGAATGTSRQGTSRGSNKRLLTGQDASDVMDAFMKGGGQAAQAAADQINKATKSVKASTASNLGSAQANVQKLTVTWATLARVVQTQLIVRALSQLRNAFSETATDAIAFQKQLALITTIDDSGRSLGQLSDSVRSVSDQFNIPLLETASGLYQTISNQIGDAGESMQFLGEAAKFAKATNSSVADSVDLLSGALKSFNLDITDTDRVSSVFFKTIDLGRISADQLANSFAQVGPAAGQLGVEVEQLGATIAAISIRGANTPQTLTQFRNILTALVKPTVAMKQALRDFNFESAESAIKTLGLDGVLRLVSKSANGSKEALADMLPNVRGLNGVAALTGDNLETLANNIKEMQEAGEKFTDSKFFQAINTDAEKVTSQINKLKNAFTVDLGQALLKTIADFAEFTGGVDNFTNIIKSSGPAILGLGTSLLSVAAAMKIAAAAGVGLAGSLGLLLLIPAAQGLGKSLGQFIDTKIFEKQFAGLKALQDKHAQDIKDLTETLEKESDKQNKADEDRVQKVRNATLATTGSYLNFRDIAITANSALVKNTKSSVDEIVHAFDRLADAQRDAAVGAKEIQKQSAERVTGLQDRLSGIGFESQTQGLSEAQKVFALSKKSAELASQASSTLAIAGGDQDKINRGLALFQQSQKAAESAQSVADKVGDVGLEARARNQLKDTINAQVDAEHKLSQSQNQRITALNKESNLTKGILDRVREQAEIVKANTGQFDTDNQPFSPQEQKRRADARGNALKNLIDLSKQIDPQKLKQLGLTDFVNQFEQSLTKEPIRLAFTIENETDRIKAQLQQAFSHFSLQLKAVADVDVKQLEKVLGKEAGSLQTPDQVFAGLDEAAAAADQIRRNLDKAVIGTEQEKNLRSEIDNIFAKISQLKASREQVQSEVAKSARSNFDAVVSLLTAVSQKSKVTKEDIDLAGNAVKSFNENIRGQDANTRISFNSSADALDLMLQKLIDIQNVQKKQTELPQVQAQQQQLQLLDDIQQRIQQSGLAGQLTTAGQNLSSGAAALSDAQIPAQSIALQAQIAGGALETGANAWIRAASVSFATPSAAPVNAAFGGLIQGFKTGGFVKSLRYFNNGGFAPKGTDTIPAMLSPGEFVVNAQSTRKFFSQLQAINSGAQPVYRADGGPLSTTTIGDVNIHVNGSQEPKRTAREVMAEFNRQTRRGASRLR